MYGTCLEDTGGSDLEVGAWGSISHTVQANPGTWLLQKCFLFQQHGNAAYYSSVLENLIAY
jgi:hypothetical protein